MASIINLPRDERFGNIGAGIGAGLQAFFDERKKKERARLFKEALEELTTQPEIAPRGLGEDEDIAEEEPTPEQVASGLEQVPTGKRLPREGDDLPPISEILSAFGEFLEPGDIAGIILSTKLQKLNKTPPLTPAQVRETAKARRAGTLEADSEGIQKLEAARAAAEAKGNSRRASMLERQIEKLSGKSLKTIGKEAEVKKAGSLKARRESIQGILDSLGRESSADIASVDNLFSGTDKASKDAVLATNLFIQARALTSAGESSLANSLITQANFLVDNSPEILRSKDLNKPISTALAAELGVPAGTTLGEVKNLTPRSPEDVTRATSEAGEIGRKIVKARADLGFIDEARVTLNGLREKLKTDPGLVGVRGSLRATGKTVVGVLSDLGLEGIVDSAKEIVGMASGDEANEVGGLLSDPTLSVLDIIENSVGLILARLQTPEGRVPVEVIKRALAIVKLRGLRSSEQVIDRLGLIDNLLSEREANIRNQFGMLAEEDQAAQDDILLGDNGEPLREFAIRNGRLVEITNE